MILDVFTKLILLYFSREEIHNLPAYWNIELLVTTNNRQCTEIDFKMCMALIKTNKYRMMHGEVAYMSTYSINGDIS